VTIVVPRKAAEDLYYAIALALGSRSGFAREAFAIGPGKKGGPRGKSHDPDPLDDIPPHKNGKPTGPPGPKPKPR
jgi:hypothetical protein